MNAPIDVSFFERAAKPLTTGKSVIFLFLHGGPTQYEIWPHMTSRGRYTGRFTVAVSPGAERGRAFLGKGGAEMEGAACHVFGDLRGAVRAANRHMATRSRKDKLTGTEAALVARMKASQGRLAVVLGPSPSPRARSRRTWPGIREFLAMNRLIKRGFAEKLGYERHVGPVRGRASRIGYSLILTGALTPAGWRTAALASAQRGMS